MKKSISVLIFIFGIFSLSIFAQNNKLKAIKYIAPKYPPAARAVRAIGNVEVLVSIDENGKVISTDVKSGHPLLRVTSEKAAKDWIFKQNDNNKTELTITFTYLIKEDKKPKNNYKETSYKTKFKKPYRLEIIATEYLRVNS